MQKIFPRTRVIMRRVHRIKKIRRRRRNWLLKNGSEVEGTQESDNDTENDSQETESSSLETSTTFHSKSPCEHCENSNAFGTITTRFVL